MRYAGFWVRALASLLDFFVMLLVAVPVVVLAELSWSISDNDAAATVIELTVNAVAVWLYFALFESGRWQATPGKRMLGLRVTNLVGRPVSFGRASGRYFGKILSILTFYIGFIMAGLTEKKQGLHDKLADTLVLYGDVKPEFPDAGSKDKGSDSAAQTIYLPQSNVDRWLISGFDADGHVVRLSFSQDTPKMAQEGLIIGRDGKVCELQMNDPSVSRRHARLFNESGTVWLEDLASANGTMVNGRPVNPGVAIELPQQGTVTFGAVELSIAKY